MIQNYSDEENNGHFIELWSQELKHNFYDTAICIATTFEGVAPFEFLQTRAQQILTANPWLAARLRTNPKTEQASLWFSNKTPSLSPFFEHIEINQVCTSGSNINALIGEAYAIPRSRYAVFFT